MITPLNFVSLPGLHLENVARGGKSIVLEKLGGASQKSVCEKAHGLLGGSGGMLPQEIFVFRLSEIESGAFSGTSLTDKLYCGMGLLEALVAILILPCDIVL